MAPHFASTTEDYIKTKLIPYCTCTIKGQLILKDLFVLFSILPKNERKISAPVGLGKNLHFQVNFLGELKTLKCPFEIN